MQGRENSGSASQLPTSSPSTFSLNPASFASELPDPSFVIGESYELYHNDSSPNSVEISSSQIVNNHTMNRSEERANEVSGSSGLDTDHTFERIKHQLSLNDEESAFNKYYFETEDSNDLDVLREYELSNLTPTSTGNIHPLEPGFFFIVCLFPQV